MAGSYRPDQRGLAGIHGTIKGVRNAEPLWRAIAVYRFASIGYAMLLVALNRAD